MSAINVVREFNTILIWESSSPKIVNCAPVLSLILIGGGDRGSSYLKYLDTNEGKFELVALAEPVAAKREYLKEKYGVKEELCFESYEEKQDFFKKLNVLGVERL